MLDIHMHSTVYCLLLSPVHGMQASCQPNTHRSVRHISTAVDTWEMEQEEKGLQQQHE